MLDSKVRNLDDCAVDILLVDDSPANLVTFEELLTAPGLNLVKCSSGEQALEVALSLRPALILLDVQMPKMDGFEVARLLRGTQRTKEIPIIFVTATHREERFTFQGFESGAVDYLFKPLNPIIIRSKVSVFVELHRNKIRLERAVHDLSVTNRELESFSSSVSHDLRAPLRAVLGFTREVLDQLNDTADEEKRAILLRVVDAGERMGLLIDGLLDLAKVVRTDIHKSHVDLTSRARAICDELNVQQFRHVTLRIKDGMTALGDKRLLESVLRNLLSNAFKFTCYTKQATIEVSAIQSEHGLTYFVRDNGAGFEMEYAQKLFGAFQRLHSSSEFPGTGIGLATVQRIIHRHGGRIWAESTPKQQTTFYFTLDDTPS